MADSTIAGKATVFFSLFLFVVLTCCKKQGNGSTANPLTPNPNSTLPSTARTLSDANEALEAVRDKLKPRELKKDENGALIPHQFLHLHHMKTGGTSMDHMLKCAMKRLEETWEIDVPYYNIHECHRGAFRRCVQNETDPCRKPMDDAAMMSYCAPLFHLDRFGWNEETVAAFTVLRHPVDRVWSMFRFEPRKCYNCKNLTDIYDMIDNDDHLGYDSLCLDQLQNHEVANLLTTDWPEDASEEDMLNEAIENMKKFFTVIGLTEELPNTRKIIGKVFPWFDDTIEGSKTMCGLPHDNSSPKNNHCVRFQKPDGKWSSSHWDLPPHPDEETRKAIEAHNQLDLKLYEAAVQHFELQMQAMNLGDES